MVLGILLICSYSNKLKGRDKELQGIIQAQEKHVEVNAILLQGLSNLQRKGPLRIGHVQEDGNNGVYGSRYFDRHRLDRSNIVRDGRLLDASDKRDGEHRYYSSSGSDRHHDHHCYRPYRRNGRGYFPDEFKKANPTTFDGDVKET